MDQETKQFDLSNRFFILIALLIGGVVISYLGGLYVSYKGLPENYQNQISVSGTGKVYAKPDIAEVSFGVTTEASTIATVTKNNTDKMNAVIEAIKSLQVDEKDIQTTNYSLTPVYENTYTPMIYPATDGGAISSGSTMIKGSALKGYKLAQNIQVKIRDFSKVGDVLTKATTTGANVVSDLQFTIEDMQKVQQEARAKAIANAKENAKNLSESSGLRLGKLVNIYEGYVGYPVAYGKGGGSAITMEDSANVAPQIQSGQLEITSSVNLSYIVK
jgi:hypothetical protein